MAFYIAQGISILTALVAVLTMQFKNMKFILLGQICANLLTAATYFLLGGISGAGISFIAILQTVIMFFYNQKNIKPHLIVVALFIISYILCSCIYYNSFIDIASSLAAICYCLSVAQKNPIASRFWYMFNPLFWMVYDIYTKAYANLLMHLVVFLSTVIALIRIDKIFERLQKNKTYSK